MSSKDSFPLFHLSDMNYFSYHSERDFYSLSLGFPFINFSGETYRSLLAAKVKIARASSQLGLLKVRFLCR